MMRQSNEHRISIDGNVLLGVEEYGRLTVPVDYIDDRGLFWGTSTSGSEDYIPSLRSGLQVQWTYSKLCNFRCVHCFNGSGPDWRGHEADPFRVADNLVAAKPYNVCLCGGEPLTWRPLVAIVEKLRRGGIPLVSTVTNGYLATPDRIKELHDAGLTTLQVSLDGVNDEQFEHLRLKSDGMSRATSAVDEALRHRWEDLSVSFTPTRLNASSWKEFCRFWAHRGVTHIRTQPFMPIGAGKYARDLAPTDEQYLQFHLDTIDLAAELPQCFVDWGDPLEHIWFWARTAAQPWSFGIQTDGWYELSCYVPVLVGSALEHSVEEFWSLDLKRLWSAPIVRRFADQLGTMHAMSELELEIYREESLHIDLFDQEQLDTFLATDDLELLREISGRNLSKAPERTTLVSSPNRVGDAAHA